MEFLRFILYPFSILYGLLTAFRNFLFDLGILPSTSFKLPVISVGNLSVGGTGKSPMVMYLLELLKDDHNISSLSRGYGRSGTGFYLADDNATARTLGDEPLQIHRRFPKLPIAVDANRRRGIRLLMKKFPELGGVILDDAFQHRYVMPGVSILLTSYDKLYINDYVLPTGSLREFKSGAKRADIIIVTKAPRLLSPIDRRLISQKLKPKPYQQVFFSYIKYKAIAPVFNDELEKVKLNSKLQVLLVTGIAKSDGLFYHLKDKVKKVTHLKFKDHHNFEMNDITKIKNAFHEISGEDKIILTTEKDAMRLNYPMIKEELGDLPLFYIPIRIEMHERDKQIFCERIIDFIRRN